MISREEYLSVGAMLIGVVILAEVAMPVPRGRPPPASATKRAAPVAAAAEPAPRRSNSPTGGADLRTNNPFTLPPEWREPFTTSGPTK